MRHYIRRHIQLCFLWLSTTTQREGKRNKWTHIFMLHVLKQSQLSVCSLGMDDGLKWSRELLHSYLQTSLHIKCRAVKMERTDMWDQVNSFYQGVSSDLKNKSIHTWLKICRKFWTRNELTTASLSFQGRWGKTVSVQSRPSLHS